MNGTRLPPVQSRQPAKPMPTPRAAILLCSLLMAAPSLLRAQSAPDLLHQLDDAFVSVFEKVAPSVVIIKADKKPTGDDQDQTFDFNFHSPDASQGPMPAPYARSEGSGFIVRPDGYIFTNFHVVEGCEKIVVTLRDKRRFPARLVGTDERTDIAVLKIDATGLPAVSFIDSNSVRTGQMCFAIGIPYNLEYSFCRGIVSGKGRSDLMSTVAHPLYEDYIQTDAFINPGNSGGPLFDIDGRVMGMVAIINGIGRGLSFAIPSDMVNEIGNTLITDGAVTHPWLGIGIKSLDNEIDDDPAAAARYHGVDSGVYVDTIQANAPAFKSDIRPMDVITKVDGVPVSTPNDLQREILHKKVGQSISLAIWRAGKTLDLPIVTAPLPSDAALAGPANPPPHDSAPSPRAASGFGIEFMPPHAQAVHDRLGAGALVAAVVYDSPAQHAGIRPGDMITQVDGKPVTDTPSCIDLLSSHDAISGPQITFTRKSAKTTVTLTPTDVDTPGKP